jgi:hypothetical protein
MKQLKHSLNQWLSALFSKGTSPSGKSVDVIRVAEGEAVELWSGGSHFGSGGGYTVSYWAAEAGPEVDTTKKGGYKDNGFMSESSGFYVMKAPMVLYTTSGDAIGEDGRVFYRRAYVCASDAQIEQAKQEEPYEPTGWKLDTSVYHWYARWQILPVYWGERADTGLHLAHVSNGNFSGAHLFYFPEDGSYPIELETWIHYNECHCDAALDDTGATPCVCSDTEIPENLERALQLLEVNRNLRKALDAYMKGGKGMMQALKAAAVLAKQGAEAPGVVGLDSDDQENMTTLGAALRKALDNANSKSRK